MHKTVFGSCLATRVVPVLHGHLEGDLIRCGSVVREKHPCQSSRGYPHQFACQENCGGIRETKEGGVRHLASLVIEGAIENRMSMAMKIDPNGGGAIQIPVTLGVEEIGPSAAF